MWNTTDPRDSLPNGSYIIILRRNGFILCGWESATANFQDGVIETTFNNFWKLLPGEKWPSHWIWSICPEYTFGK